MAQTGPEMSVGYRKAQARHFQISFLVMVGVSLYVIATLAHLRKPLPLYNETDVRQLGAAIEEFDEAWSVLESIQAESELQKGSECNGPSASSGNPFHTQHLTRPSTFAEYEEKKAKIGQVSWYVYKESFEAQKDALIDDFILKICAVDANEKRFSKLKETRYSKLDEICDKERRPWLSGKLESKVLVSEHQCHSGEGDLPMSRATIDPAGALRFLYELSKTENEDPKFECNDVCQSRILTEIGKKKFSKKQEAIQHAGFDARRVDAMARMDHANDVVHALAVRDWRNGSQSLLDTSTLKAEKVNSEEIMRKKTTNPFTDPSYAISGPSLLGGTIKDVAGLYLLMLAVGIYAIVRGFTAYCANRRLFGWVEGDVKSDGSKSPGWEVVGLAVSLASYIVWRSWGEPPPQEPAPHEMNVKTLHEMIWVTQLMLSWLSVAGLVCALTTRPDAKPDNP